MVIAAPRSDVNAPNQSTIIDTEVILDKKIGAHDLGSATQQTLGSSGLGFDTGYVKIWVPDFPPPAAPL